MGSRVVRIALSFLAILLLLPTTAAAAEETEREAVLQDLLKHARGRSERFQLVEPAATASPPPRPYYRPRRLSRGREGPFFQVLSTAGWRARHNLELERLYGRNAGGHRIPGLGLEHWNRNLTYDLDLLDAPSLHPTFLLEQGGLHLAASLSLGASRLSLREEIGTPSLFRYGSQSGAVSRAESEWGWRMGGRFDFGHTNPAVPSLVLLGAGNFVFWFWVFIVAAGSGCGCDWGEGFGALLLWPFALLGEVDDDTRIGTKDTHMVFGFEGEVDYGAYAFDRQELFDRMVSGRGHFWEYRLGLYTGVRILNRALLKVGGEYVDGALSFDLAGRSRAPEEWTLRGRAWDVAAFAELTVFQLAGLGFDFRASTAGGGTVSVSTGAAF